MDRLLAGLAAVLIGCAAQPLAAVEPTAAELLDEILQLPGVVSAVEASSTIPDTYFFQIEFEQPVDHADPLGPTFLERVTLLHRSLDAPMVLATSGYGISLNSSQRELTYLLQANQLYLEHRFFDPSSPDPKVWEALTIEQAAADFHAVVESFKGLYTGKWVSTGASKGGMAVVYHRAFYPDDVDATVPYVAPSSRGTEDVRYRGFLDRVGTAQCRGRLAAFQALALEHREEIVPLITATYGADEFGYFGEDRALEFAVLELPFGFWQYESLDLCDAIPQAGANVEQMFAFIDAVSGVAFFGDSLMDYFAPYYYQGATQLGGPRLDERALDDAGLLSYPGEDVYASYPPYEVEKKFERFAMPAIERWVRNRGTRMLFIYGEYDPWSSGAFEPREANDSYRFFVPQGNHGSSILMLPADEQAQAIEHLESWMGVTITLPAPPAALGETPRELPYDPFPLEELFLR